MKPVRNVRSHSVIQVSGVTRGQLQVLFFCYRYYRYNIVIAWQHMLIIAKT